MVNPLDMPRTLYGTSEGKHSITHHCPHVIILYIIHFSSTKLRPERVIESNILLQVLLLIRTPAAFLCESDCWFVFDSSETVSYVRCETINDKHFKHIAMKSFCTHIDVVFADQTGLC